MSRRESPFAAIDPPESRRAKGRAEYHARAPHSTDPRWKLGDPPECPECKGPCSAVAYHDGDGWGITWDCLACEDGEPHGSSTGISGTGRQGRRSRWGSHAYKRVLAP